MQLFNKTMKLEPVKTLSSKIIQYTESKVELRERSFNAMKVLCEDGSIWRIRYAWDKDNLGDNLWQNIVPPVKGLTIIYSLSAYPPESMPFSEFIDPNNGHLDDFFLLRYLNAEEEDYSDFQSQYIQTKYTDERTNKKQVQYVLDNPDKPFYHFYHSLCNKGVIVRDLVTRKNQIILFDFFLEHVKLGENELYTYK